MEELAFLILVSSKGTEYAERRLAAEVLLGLDEEGGTTNLRYPRILLPGMREVEA